MSTPAAPLPLELPPLSDPPAGGVPGPVAPLLAGLVAAGLFLAATHVRQLVWAASNDANRRDEAWRLLSQGPAERVVPRLGVLAPEERGRLHEVLSQTKDPAHVPAVLAYARALLARSPAAFDQERPRLVESLRRFGPGAESALSAALQSAEPRLVALAAEALGVASPDHGPLTPERR